MIGLKTKAAHCMINFQSGFGIPKKGVRPHDGIEEQRRGAGDAAEDGGGGGEVSGAGVHCDHLGSKEGVGAEASEYEVSVELLAQVLGFQGVVAGEELEDWGVA